MITDENIADFCLDLIKRANRKEDISGELHRLDLDTANRVSTGKFHRRRLPDPPPFVRYPDWWENRTRGELRAVVKYFDEKSSTISENVSDMVYLYGCSTRLMMRAIEREDEMAKAAAEEIAGYFGREYPGYIRMCKELGHPTEAAQKWHPLVEESWLKDAHGKVSWPDTEF